MKVEFKFIEFVIILSTEKTELVVQLVLAGAVAVIWVGELMSKLAALFPEFKRSRTVKICSSDYDLISC